MHDGFAFYVSRFFTSNEPKKYFSFPHKSISKFTKSVRFDVMIPKEDDEQKALDQAHGFWIKF
jgi:hypothetical protein